MTRNQRTANHRQRFVANIQQMMLGRGLTPRQTAKQAGISEVKRFYRWASKGITRATREHDEDLERLRRLFGLPTVTMFWAEIKPAPPANAVVTQRKSLAHRLQEAGEVSEVYRYADRLLFILRHLGPARVRQICEAVDSEFNRLMKGQTPAMTLDQMATDFQIDEPKAYANLLQIVHGDRNVLLGWLKANRKANGQIPEHVMEVLLSWRPATAESDK